MARDFRANQIRTTQIIASGGIGPSAAGKSSIGLLIYSASDASGLNGGLTHDMTASVGTDVWMFVSGTNEGKSKKSGVVCFGGDIVVSGVFYAEKMVVEVTEATTGSLYVSGNLFVSGNGNIRGGLVVNDEGLAVGDFRVESDGEDEALFLDASANILYINKGETTFETVISNVTDEVLRIDAEGIVINEDSHADIDFRVESGNVASAIAVNAGTDKITIDGGAAAADALTLKAGHASGGIDIDAGTGGIAIDSTGVVSIDGADDMNFTITSSTGGEDLTIQQVGANDSSIIITAAGTGTDAVKIDATAGDMLVGPTLADGKTLKLGKSGAVEVTIAPHGTAGSEKYTVTNTAGTAVDAISLNAAAGGILINADASKIHLDAEGTGTDAVNIDSAGGIDIDASGVVAIGAAGGGEFVVAGAGNDLTLSSEGGSLYITGSDNVGIQGEANSASAVVIRASHAGGGIDIDTGTGGIAVDANGVLSIDAVGPSNVTTKGILTVSGSSGLNLKSDGGTIDIETRVGSVDIDSAGTLTLDSAQAIAIGSNADKPIDIDSTTLDIDASGAVTIDSTSTFSLDGVGTCNVTTHGNLALSGSDLVAITSDGGEIDITARQGLIDINATAGAIDIDAGTTIDIDGAGGINIGKAADVAWDFDSAAVDWDASGAVNITTTGVASDITLVSAHTAGVAFFLDANAAAGSIVDIDAGILDIDSAGDTTIDAGGTFSIDGVGPSNVTTRGILTVSGSTKSLITSTAATALAVQLDASHAAGGVDIRAGTSGVNIATNASAIPVTIGHTTSETRVNDNLTILGDVGARGFVSASLGFSGSLTRLHDGKSFIEAGENITVSSASNGAVTIAATAGGSPGGSDTNLQYNNGGSFGGLSKLTWDDTDFLLGTGATTKLQFRDSGLFINSRADGQLDIVSDTRLTLTGSGAVADAVALQNSNAAGGIDIDAGNKGITIDTTGILYVTSSNNNANAIQLFASAGGLSLVAAGAAGEDIDIRNTNGSIQIVGGENQANAVRLHASNAAGGLDIDTGTGGVAIDTTGVISIDAVGTSNLTTKGALTLSGSLSLSLASDAGEIDLTTRQGNIDINSTAGNIDIDAGGTIDIDAAGGINIGKATDVAFDVDTAALDVDSSGAVNITTTGAASDITLITAHTAGVAFFLDANANAGSIVDIDAGILDIDVTGNTTIDAGGTFSVDAVGASNLTTNGALTLSGSLSLNLASDAGEIDITTRQGNVDINATAGTIDLAAGATLSVSSAGVILNEGGFAATDFRVETDGKTHGMFVDSGNNAVLLGSDSLPGADVFTFISGSVGDHSSGTGVRGTTLVGGDLVTSGVMYGKQLEYTYHCYNRSNADAVFIGWYNNNEATGNIDDVQGVMPFSGRPVRIIVRPENDLGATTVGFHKASDGIKNIGTTPVESITSFSGADATSVGFEFTVTGSAAPTARFDAGDIVGISINPTNSPGDCNVTCIWELVTHRIISGSAIK